MPHRGAMHRHTFADNRTLCRLRRDDRADTDDAFLLRRFRQQGYWDIGFNIVRPDISGRRAVGFEKLDNGVGVALGNIDSYGDGLFAVERSVLCGAPGCCLSALDLLNDAVEIGVHVGVFGRAELTLDVREVLDSEVVVRRGGRNGRGRVG